MAPSVPRQRKVLIVDDHSDCARMLARVVELLGHRPVIADGYAAALEAARFQRFDVVVSEVVLDDADGCDLAAALRQAQPDIRTMAVTGQFVTSARCLAAEFEVRLLKPVDFDTLQVAFGKLGVHQRYVSPRGPFSPPGNN